MPLPREERSRFNCSFCRAKAAKNGQLEEFPEDDNEHRFFRKILDLQGLTARSTWYRIARFAAFAPRFRPFRTDSLPGYGHFEDVTERAILPGLESTGLDGRQPGRPPAARREL